MYKIYLMLLSIDIVFPCKYSILMGLIIMKLLLLPNETVIRLYQGYQYRTDGTNFDGSISWRCNKNYAGRFKTYEDEVIIYVISESNYAPNPVDKLTFYFITKCYLY